jgi:hypothetical protein
MTMKASIPKGGLPGQAIRYVLATEFADGRKSLPTGEPGVYCVRFTLVRPESPDHDPRSLSRRAHVGLLQRPSPIFMTALSGCFSNQHWQQTLA